MNSQVIKVYCAGSLREVLLEMALRYRAEYGPEVAIIAGPSGTLRERIESGDRPDLFCSANMEHPAKLSEARLSGPTALFVKNRICAIHRADRGFTPANLLDRLLDPATRLGTSQPVADPGGDYAWIMFKKADAIRPGSFERLSGKARQLIRGAVFPPVRPGTSSIAEAFNNDEIDVSIAYVTTAQTLMTLVPGLAMTEFPASLAVKAYFGLTMVRGARSETGDFVLYLLSPAGQKIFAEFGFMPAYELS